MCGHVSKEMEKGGQNCNTLTLSGTLGSTLTSSLTGINMSRS
jgi:hypothetical protein